MIKHNFCANASAEIEITASKIGHFIKTPCRTIGKPFTWCLHLTCSQSKLKAIAGIIAMLTMGFESVAFLLAMMFTWCARVENEQQTISSWHAYISFIIGTGSAHVITTSFLTNFGTYSLIFLTGGFVIIAFLALMIGIAIGICHGIIYYDQCIKPKLRPIYHAIKKYKVNVRDAKLQKELK